MKKVRHFCILAFFLEEDFKREALLFLDEITEEIQNRYPNLEILPRKGNQDDYDIREGIE